MVLPDSHRVARAPWYSGTIPEACPFCLKGCHLLWPDFPDGSARDRFCNSAETLPCLPSSPTTPNAQRRQACMHSVWAIPRSLATTGGISVDFFSWGYLDVSVPPVHYARPMYSAGRWRDMTPAGFPHSDICGSTPACDFPQLFAANHVLHRLLTPRHSPCALSSLTTNLLWLPEELLRPFEELLHEILLGPCIRGRWTAGLRRAPAAPRRGNLDYAPLFIHLATRRL